MLSENGALQLTIAKNSLYNRRYQECVYKTREQSLQRLISFICQGQARRLGGGVRGVQTNPPPGAEFRLGKTDSQFVEPVVVTLE